MMKRVTKLSEMGFKPKNTKYYFKINDFLSFLSSRELLYRESYLHNIDNVLEQYEVERNLTLKYFNELDELKGWDGQIAMPLGDFYSYFTLTTNELRKKLKIDGNILEIDELQVTINQMITNLSYYQFIQHILIKEISYTKKEKNNFIKKGEK